MSNSANNQEGNDRGHIKDHNEKHKRQYQKHELSQFAELLGSSGLPLLCSRYFSCVGGRGEAVFADFPGCKKD